MSASILISMFRNLIKVFATEVDREKIAPIRNTAGFDIDFDSSLQLKYWIKIWIKLKPIKKDIFKS